MANIHRPTPQEALRMRRDAQARSRKCAGCGAVVAKTNVGEIAGAFLCVGEGTNDCYGTELESRFREAGLR